MSGSAPGLHTSGSGNLGGTVGAAQTSSKSPVLVGISAGLAVCLIAGAVAAYVLWPRPATSGDMDTRAVAVPIPEAPRPADAPPTVDPAPVSGPTEAPTAAAPAAPPTSSAAAKPTVPPKLTGPKPAPKPAAPSKTPKIVRD